MQALWLQTAFIFIQGAALVGAVILTRRGHVAPLVIFGAAMLFSRGLGALVSYFTFAASTAPVVEVLAHYVRIAPNVVLLIYVCMMQARRYRAVRNNNLLRVWFRRALYVHGALYLISLVGDLIWPAALLKGAQSIPPAAFLFEAPGYVLGIAYGSIASVVFLGTARTKSGPPRLSQRLQNLFWGIAMAGFSALLAYAFVWRGIRAFSPEGLTEALAGLLGQVEVAFVIIYAGGIVAGIFAYYVQSERGRFVERYLSFLELVGDLTEEMANAPVTKGKLNLPYASMLEAAGEEFLNLSPTDKRRADNAFRVKTLWEDDASDDEGEPRDRGYRTRRISRRRLHGLAEAYDDELKEPVLAEGLRREAGEKELPGTLRDLLPKDPTEGDPDAADRQGLSEALSFAIKTGDEEPVPAPSAEWEQLVYVALADAGILSDRQQKDAILPSDAGLSKRVLDTYCLARHKIDNHRENLAGRSADDE